MSLFPNVNKASASTSLTANHVPSFQTSYDSALSNGPRLLELTLRVYGGEVYTLEVVSAIQALSDVRDDLGMAL